MSQECKSASCAVGRFAGSCQAAAVTGNGGDVAVAQDGSGGGGGGEVAVAAAGESEKFEFCNMANEGWVGNREKLLINTLR